MVLTGKVSRLTYDGFRGGIFAEKRLGLYRRECRPYLVETDNE